MKGALLAMLICLSCAAQAEGDRALLLRGAAHCLAAKSFLPSTEATERTFGYILDEKSYPDERVLYVVAYPSASRRKGFVFTIFLTEHNGRLGFNIQNNARFFLSKDDVDGGSFVDPPLGGVWTQEHLMSAIKQIVKRPRFIISDRDMLAPEPPNSCESYTDPQP